MENKGKRIVVMGGSFNPPTAAHHEIMRLSLEAVNADKGIFVPVSDAYLKRKMRSESRPVVLSPELRLDMLYGMAGSDPRMEVRVDEMDTVEPQTMATLHGVREENPDAEIWFVMGDDKLGLLRTLTQKRGFMDHFKALLYTRKESDIENALSKNEVLAPHLSRITIVSTPDEIVGISSSLARERMLMGESAEDLLHPEVWKFFKGCTISDFPEVINRFKDDYAFLSNSFECPMVWEKNTYKCVDTAFKSSIKKAADPDSIAEQEKLMEELLRAKFAQNPDLREKLLATAGKILLNGTNKKNPVWGVDLYSWEGENRLGKLLMKIREAI